jgi:hypothetical protein
MWKRFSLLLVPMRDLVEKFALASDMQNGEIELPKALKQIMHDVCQCMRGPTPKELPYAAMSKGMD